MVSPDEPHLVSLLLGRLGPGFPSPGKTGTVSLPLGRLGPHSWASSTDFADLFGGVGQITPLVQLFTGLANAEYSLSFNKQR